ncbi:zinc ribbon domain-containing protein, partial [Planctomycetaceae bacterium]|nr:zinc ribbon domain-containing protein [Planctomycetaceae bacterium]
CPECKSRKARRVIGPGAGILFKGSGFYQTDYRSDSYKKGAAAEKKAQSSATKSESKSESKSSDSSSKSSSTNKKSD